MIFARLAVILAAVSASVAVAAQQEFQLKVNVSLVSVDVGVYDRRGEAITTLKKDDFLILEDDQPQEIRAFEPSGVAFNALLVVDQSGSMRGAWDSMVSGLNRFMEVLRAQDRVAIAAFANLTLAFPNELSRSRLEDSGWNFSAGRQHEPTGMHVRRTR